MQQNFDIQKMMKLAASPAGRQLMQALRQSAGSDMEKAAALASSGNMEQAKQSLFGILSDPAIQELLRQLEGQL